MAALIPNIPRGLLKLKTLCVGREFSQPAEPARPDAFPWNVWKQTDEFNFKNMPALKDAQALLAQDQDIDLVFLDTDGDTPSELAVFMTQVKSIRPKLPVIIFAYEVNDIVYDLLKRGPFAWPVLKDAGHVQGLVREIQDHIFAHTDWQGILTEFTRDDVKPIIEPGLDSSDTDVLIHRTEEAYIIKRLFANSEQVQVFRMDEGFSGSRIYTVRPSGQRKRILKIEAADSLETVREKQERLIQPRLDQRIGQIQGEVIIAQHIGGACYTLAGSVRETITLSKFLQDHNQVRREQIDSIFEQLKSSLGRLYAGGSDVEMRYWAPLYARELPPELTLEDATLVQPDFKGARYVLKLDELTNLSAIPGNRTLENIRQAVRKGEQPEILLDGFVVSELDTAKGILYLHDDLMERKPFHHGLTTKDHAVLRFKIRLKESEREMLTHPIFRHGKRICVRGRAVDTQEEILARNIAGITGQKYDHAAQVLEFEGGRFIPPLKNMRYLLWEVGRNDMINPAPQISPVVHGDLNTSNILVEVNDEIPVWLIDFAEAKPGHIYLDLAKLEVEFRTHILYRLFKGMIEEQIWDRQTVTKFALLMENILYGSIDKDFDDFTADFRAFEPEWYEQIDSHFPLYFENLLYFIYNLRHLARTYSPERFRYHYPVAVFFQSLTALKYDNLDRQPWHPWSKLLALCSTLVSGRQALAEARITEEPGLFSALRERSAFALIYVGSGDEHKYLLQWNDNWRMFNLVGGKMDPMKDRDSYARTVLREIQEELGLGSKDCRITREYKPLLLYQFSKRDHVFKDYEFHLFQIDFLPKHPASPPEFHRIIESFPQKHATLLVSRLEVEQLMTLERKQISDTTKIILGAVGEIENRGERTSIPLALYLDSDHIQTSRGRAKLTAHLVNPPFAKAVQKIVLEILPSPQYEIDKNTATIHVERIKAGEEKEIVFWLIPKARQATVGVQATYYYDVKSKEQQQFFEFSVTFESGVGYLIRQFIENPFIVGAPLNVASESLFVGREDIFSWIEENLIGKTQPHTLILYGPRRMGKTSILYQLAWGQRGQNIREYPGCPVFPVHLNLQGTAGRNTRELLQELGKQITRALTSRRIHLIPPSWSMDASPFADFDEFLERVEKALPAAGILLIMLDEFEQLQAGIDLGQISSDILSYLRAKVQSRSRIAFMFVGAQRLNEMRKDYVSTLFQIGLINRVGPLSRIDTEKLIREPVFPTVQYEDSAVEKIWSVTQGHPYFVQLICHNLISMLNQERNRQYSIDASDVGRIIRKIIHEHDDQMQYMWNETTREEQMVLAALSMHPESHSEGVSRSEISARLQRSTLSGDILNRALDLLQRHDLVKMQAGEGQNSSWDCIQDVEAADTDKEYFFSITYDLFRQWVARKHSLGSLLS